VCRSLQSDANISRKRVLCDLLTALAQTSARNLPHGTTATHYSPVRFFVYLQYRNKSSATWLVVFNEIYIFGLATEKFI
jgi:hypothetical protein